jgi:hypothetical protein
METDQILQTAADEAEKHEIIGNYYRALGNGDQMSQIVAGIELGFAMMGYSKRSTGLKE